MIMSLVLFENEFLHIVSISFTALILNELIMVALEITTWYIVFGPTYNILLLFCVLRHIYMVVSEVVTLFFYVISVAFLPAYFGMHPFCLVVFSKKKDTRIDDCLQIFRLSLPRLLPGKSLSLWLLALFRCTYSSL